MLKGVQRFLDSAIRKLNRLASISSVAGRRSVRFGRDKVTKTKSAPIGDAAVPTTEGASRQEGHAAIPQRRQSPRIRRAKTAERRGTDWTADDFPVPPLPGKSRFHDFSLSPLLMRGIAGLNFRYCTPIQEHGLPHVLAGRDLIGRAQTGTGKTAVFLIGLFNGLLAQSSPSSSDWPRALIIAPTRELVLQIVSDGKALGAYSGLHIGAVYGGSDLRAQEERLRERCYDIIAATPGRLLDFLRRRVISLERCRYLVIDEADRMLDMGFLPDVRRILAMMPDRSERQTMLFSATISDDVRRLAERWCNDPVYEEADEQHVPVDKIEQRVYLTTSEQKFVLLYHLINNQREGRILIFENMKSHASRLATRLREVGIEALLLTGDVPQSKRLRRLESFRSGAGRVMVATDVAGRGIHIGDITLVVNYTLPDEPENYVHRIGRTGRAGADGKAISFACEQGSFAIPEIEAYLGRPLRCIEPEPELTTIPSGSGIVQAGRKRPRRARRKRATGAREAHSE